jgi:hypothetical protein
MPYTLSRPAGETNRWRMHRELILAGEPLVASLFDLSPEARHRYLHSTRETDQELLRIIDRIVETYALAAL